MAVNWDLKGSDDRDPMIEGSYQDLYRRSIENPEEFWGSMATNSLDWFAPWNSVLEIDEEEFNQTWFSNGKLNASYNCLDRHAMGERRVKAALIWQGESREESKIFTYKQLLYEVSRFANVLKKLNIGKGDRVSIYLPMIPELPIAMLACARIGAIHNVILAGFSAEALETRIEDSKSKLIVTSDGAYRGGDLLPLKFNVDIALSNGLTVNNVLVVRRTGMPVEMIEGRDFWWHERMSEVSSKCEPVEMSSSDPLFILYTSGFTSTPKGVTHSTAGYLLFTALSYKWMFEPREKDIHWCTGDIGWITGHSYAIYGPLCHGSTTLMYEGAPKYPRVDRYWEIVEKFGVNSLYTTPTIIRAIMKDGDAPVKGRDLLSLRVLGCVGEAINPQALRWYRDIIGGGKCPVVNSWWQTETGGACIATFPKAPGSKPCSVGKPFFGIEPMVLLEDGTKARSGESGLLTLKGRWPGLFSTTYGDHEWYKETYFSEFQGLFFTGDCAMIDEDGDIWILGRVDDVIKISGNRIGSVEVEHVLTGHNMVADAAVVPIPHQIKGEGIYCFVTLRNGYEGSEELESELVRHLRAKMGPIVTPECIHFCNELPKSKNGKIIRPVLRKIANRDLEDIGDVTGLANSKAIRDLILTRPRH
jgi:acetyl-CoA synthetase